VRSDGFANALLISVEPDHRAEFDALWRWADANLVLRSGPLRDYVLAHCPLTGSPCPEEVQALPHFTTVTALWLAAGRWGTSGDIDYATVAARLMAAVFRTEPDAASTLGALDGLVDATRLLPRASPYTADAANTGPSTMTPAFFALWAEKSGDEQALSLAEHARTYWSAVVDPTTGLVPDTTSLDGVVASGGDVFTATSYAFFLALALDAIWFPSSSSHEEQANLVLALFHAQTPKGQYATQYSLDGTPAAAPRYLLSLAAPLGAVASVATQPYRVDFIQAVWDARLDTGTSRKFGNFLYLTSELILSGRLRVY
jgi:oligosaccharide reducing-end xylanase